MCDVAEKLEQIGIKKGRTEGEEKASRLYFYLKRDGRLDDMDRALVDPAYRELLYKEYGIF